MAKIDLKKSAGFDLVYDQGSLISQDLTVKRSKMFSIDDIREQLLNRELSYPEHCYTKFYSLDHEGVFEEKGFKVNICVIPQNLAGIEFIKTRALRADTPRIMEVLSGGGTIIVQNYIKGENDVIVSKVKRDQKILIPKGYAVSLINTRQSSFIISEVIPMDAKLTPVLDEMNGMAYYVIRKNAKQEVVRNPLYKDVVSYRKVVWEKIVQNYGITLKTPLIKQILRKHEKFEWLYANSGITIEI